jgi:hypothetical protein
MGSLNSLHLLPKCLRVIVSFRRTTRGICTYIPLLVMIAGGVSRGQNPNVAIGLRITSETAPVGGTVQVKIFATTPQSIASGNISIVFDNSEEISPKILATQVFSANGDASGFAYFQDFGGFWITFSSPIGGHRTSSGLADRRVDSRGRQASYDRYRS